MQPRVASALDSRSFASDTPVRHGFAGSDLRSFAARWRVQDVSSSHHLKSTISPPSQSSGLKERLAELIPEQRQRVAAFRKEHGGFSLGTSTIEQVREKKKEGGGGLRERENTDDLARCCLNDETLPPP